MYTTIVHPTDGSTGARRAADHAIELAQDHDATLHIVSVVDRRRFEEPALSSAELAVDAIEDQAHGHVESLRRRAESEGVQVHTRVSHGVPADEILDYARQVGADAIVLGTRGERSMPGLGSVTRRVVTQAECAVLTV
ncbi:MAG: universal stress protein [Haloarculaceae archaeon]